MSFDSLKFVVRRYLNDESLKTDTLFFSNWIDSVLDSLEKYKDFGILIQANGNIE